MKNKSKAFWILFVSLAAIPFVLLYVSIHWFSNQAGTNSNDSNKIQQNDVALSDFDGFIGINSLFVVDLKGELTPCGCSADQGGTLSRVSTFISRNQQNNSIIVFMGNICSRPSTNGNKVKIDPDYLTGLVALNQKVFAEFDNVLWAPNIENERNTIDTKLTSGQYGLICWVAWPSRP